MPSPKDFDISVEDSSDSQPQRRVSQHSVALHQLSRQWDVVKRKSQTFRDNLNEKVPEYHRDSIEYRLYSDTLGSESRIRWRRGRG